MNAVLQSLPMIAVTVLAFGLLIVIHELGHYLAARWSGMRVERFSVGFGPVIWSRRRGDTEWAVSAIPLGGYVKIAGMAPGEEIAADDRSAYSHQPAWRRFLVILAGPAMNYLLAVVLAAGLIATLGLREPDSTSTIGDVIGGGAAERAGLRPGDRIVAAAGAPIAGWTALVTAVRAHPGQDLSLEVERPGEPPGSPPVTRTVTIRPDDSGGIGKAGIGPHLRAVQAGPAEAVAMAFQKTNDKAGEILGGLGQVVTRKQKAELQGPLGIAQEMTRSARAGVAPFLMMVWLISLMLAIFNFLPLPALDGGRLVFLVYEIVARRPVNQKAEAVIHTVGFLALLALLLGVTVFGDLPRLFRR
jgi:regulator of sigma E protease